jgi:4-diphosphocytidyl-2-C-methyl-D-erythritol kinase
MICFPNAKINLGLKITGKRKDGYHNIETVFYPVPLRDALEAVPAKETAFTQTGLHIDNLSPDNNLVMKAYQLMNKKHKLPPLSVYLKKTIPPGAGLGGGSSDAAFMLRLLNRLCEFKMTYKNLEKMAVTLGADCPFFVGNRPAVGSGIGEILKPVELSLKDYIIYIVKPPVMVSTKEAYSMVTPGKSVFDLNTLPSVPVSLWKDVLTNDFESVVFRHFPIIRRIKDEFYANGAEYAAMSGSGSAVFGLFKKSFMPHFPGCFVWKGILE